MKTKIKTNKNTKLKAWYFFVIFSIKFNQQKNLSNLNFILTFLFYKNS
ncbi:hypothetical protein HMPREF3224_01485 [Anaerococcus hydrogenalis]|nr:hypothetical protein HMPREF3224_01485 [Anaerococcus hydrogenalis]